MTTLIIDKDVWDNKIKPQLIERYGLSAFLIRSRMRRDLGFTVREHIEWRKTEPPAWDKDNDDWSDYVTDVRLDFYDEAALTMFRLLYLPSDLQEN